MIDLNCDMGESFGRYTLGQDAALMPLITSANIACGYHAGDPLVMQATLRLAKQHGVSVGAHPGWPDLQGFGRREMAFSPAEVEALLLYQIGALAGIARAEGLELSHVKPHGALYNQAARDATLAAAVARAVQRFSRHLTLVGLAGSQSLAAAAEIGLPTLAEGFPDRAYLPDGSLMPRSWPGAVLESPALVAQNAVRLAREGNGTSAVDTLCLHGDNPRALENARAVRDALQLAGIRVARLAASPE